MVHTALKRDFSSSSVTRPQLWFQPHLCMGLTHQLSALEAAGTHKSIQLGGGCNAQGKLATQECRCRGGNWDVQDHQVGGG